MVCDWICDMIHAYVIWIGEPWSGREQQNRFWFLILNIEKYQLLSILMMPVHCRNLCLRIDGMQIVFVIIREIGASGYGIIYILTFRKLPSNQFKCWPTQSLHWKVFALDVTKRNEMKKRKRIKTTKWGVMKTGKSLSISL